MTFIEEIIKLLIPKLSKELFSRNITQEIENINKKLHQTLEYEEGIIDENSNNNEAEPENNGNSLRNRRRRRRISEEESNAENNEISNNNINYETKEAEKEYSNNTNDNNTYQAKGYEKEENFLNITEYDFDRLESLEAKLEGSEVKTIKNSFLDNNGMIYLINQLETATIYQPDSNSIKRPTAEEEQLKNEIYNDKNEIERNETFDEIFSGNDALFKISTLKVENTNNATLTDNINSKKLVSKIFGYFYKFSYSKYNSSENNNLNLRFLKYKDELKADFFKSNNNKDSELEIEHTKLTPKKHRKLQINTDTYTYYGLKNFEKEKIIFKYNLFGFILEGITVSKLNISTGITDNYFKLTLGYINYKMKFQSIQTNIHKVIENSNQMSYNYGSLLSN